MKKIVTSLLVLFFIPVSVFSFGSSVVIQMAQHGTDDETIKETTILIEDGILDILFESGYIVTNLPITVLLSYDSLQEKMISDAISAYMNTIVYVGVNYHDYSIAHDKTIAVSDIDTIDVKFINARKKSVLFEESIDGIQKGQYETDITAVKHFANSIGLEIKQQLEKL